MHDPLTVAYQRQTVDCPRGGQSCPSADAIADAMRGAGTSDTLDALASCARCTAIAQIESGLQTQLNERQIRRLQSRRRAPWKWAIAASLLIVLSTGMLLPLLRPPAADDVLRGSAGELHPAIGSELAASPIEFRWSVPAGAICRVDVRNPQGERVWRSAGVRGGKVKLETPLAAGAYLWIVRCAADELGPFHFRVL
jgi:hypothetical protein